MNKNAYHILLAEDDIDFGNILKQYLEMNGFKVSWCKNGMVALELFLKETFDICVLDVMMPKMDGFSLAEKIIEEQPEIPFVFLTARKLKEDKLKGLKLGADDYIVKPFDADELILRLQNIIKRSTTSSSIREPKNAKVNIGAYLFDIKRLTLTYQENVQQLTEKEANLISFLFERKNQMLKREEILQAVWKNDDYFSGRSMDVFISRLRKYFKEDSQITIKSTRGVGIEFKL